MQHVEVLAPSATSGRRSDVRHATLATPAVLRWSAIVIVVAIAVLGAIQLRGVVARRDANAALAHADASLLADTEGLYVALADADATATTAFLRAGVEDIELRERYVNDIKGATQRLAAIAGWSGLDGTARGVVQSLNTDLANYHGDVEAARANSRARLIVGAAYLRGASDLMRTSMLPAATSLYDIAARRLEDRREQGGSAPAPVALLVGSLVVLTLLAGVQAFLAWRTRRALNVLLLAATACVALVSWHQLNDYRVQAVQLDRADRVGAEPMMAMATARILALRALSDSQLQLVERGTVPDHVEDFDRVIDSLRGGALLDRAAAAGADVTGVTAELERFVGIHEGIRALDEEGNHRDAVELAVTEQVASARRLDASILAIGTAARVAFGIGIATAGARLHHEGLELGLLAAALALVVVGLSIRWREYR